MEDKIKGCLIGGAVGDALGYAVEFLSYDKILEKYNGVINEYDLTRGNGVALISDDTQMTLFTLVGLINAFSYGKLNNAKPEYVKFVHANYLDWLYGQAGIENKYRRSWLKNIKGLVARRGPGTTCLTALASLSKRSVKNPINDSKGCGGIMRVAPVALFLALNNYKQEEIDNLGAEIAAITHGHELGYISSAMQVHIISKILNGWEIKDAVVDSIKAIQIQFPDSKHLQEQLDLVNKSIELSERDIDDIVAIRELGEGWVAEETLAIAIYSALKYKDDFEKAMICAVNHDGDSDSTGAVCGNILGAYLGYEKIPNKFNTNLELRDLIIELSNDLMQTPDLNELVLAFDNTWKSKYIDMNYDKFDKLNYLT